MLRPCTVSFDQAVDFVRRHHRHHDAPVGHRFSLGCWDGRRHHLCGVVMVGRPVARAIDQQQVVEVTRCCTDGTRNACSFLYSGSAEVARHKGFAAIITYTMTRESGASLRALGWWGEEDATPGRSWDVPNRPRGGGRGDAMGPKTRWLKMLNEFGVRAPQPVKRGPRTADMFDSKACE